MNIETSLAIFATKWWIGKSDHEICLFQLFEDRLCMPQAEFYKALESVLKRPVYIHEFGSDRKNLQKEFFGVTTE